MTANIIAINTLSLCSTHLMINTSVDCCSSYNKVNLSILSLLLMTANIIAITNSSSCSTHLIINTFVQCCLS